MYLQIYENTCKFVRVKEKLLGKTLRELQEAAVSCGLKPFVGKQLADWLYAKRVGSWDRMNNISKDSKARLQERYELGTSAPAGIAESSDGTRKYLFGVHPLKGGEPQESVSYVEAVMIPDDDRRTLCVSSQAGCKMGCKFCMTGRQGWHGDLDAADILNQFLSIDEASALTNTVFMGMGEPLDNYGTLCRVIEVLTADWGFAWSPKRITVSTIGVMPALEHYLQEQKCHLAVSLHNPFPDERAQMMPAQKAFAEGEILRLIKRFDFSGQRRVSFEYTMFDGFNDDLRHADALIRMLRGLECRVNLIRFHKIPDFPYGCSPAARMEAFRDRLNNNGITCTIRSSRGEDILAACGMLAGKLSSRQQQD
ncbi:MAG: 23S rRNA (adenine(2503)-C(2))-methyltransferase RlmN [Bacteroidales bacterium]|nr:23S rRNA (adenine(2503)-C(2))-methyltransferase RlmN [Candidatus Cryptobacteroides equifaecalis]